MADPNLRITIKKDVAVIEFERALESFESACIDYGAGNNEYGRVISARGDLMQLMLSAIVDEAG